MTERLAAACPVCGRELLPGQVWCLLDVLFSARRATRAYELVKRSDPSLSEDQLVETALLWISSGHARHISPQLGCPFCRIVAA